MQPYNNILVERWEDIMPQKDSQVYGVDDKRSAKVHRRGLLPHGTEGSCHVQRQLCAWAKWFRAPLELITPGALGPAARDPDHGITYQPIATVSPA